MELIKEKVRIYQPLYNLLHEKVGNSSEQNEFREWFSQHNSQYLASPCFLLLGPNPNLITQLKCIDIENFEIDNKGWLFGLKIVGVCTIKIAVSAEIDQTISEKVKQWFDKEFFHKNAWFG